MPTPVLRDEIGRGSGDLYRDLCCDFPPRPIHSDDQLRRTIDRMNEVLASGDERLNGGEVDSPAMAYVELLSDLIHKYEGTIRPEMRATDSEILSEMIALNGMTQRDFAEAIGIANSTISDIVNGKRRLTRDQIGQVCAFFAMPESVFRFDAGANPPGVA